LSGSRHGRHILGESAEVGNIVDVASKYIARRIVERELALSADQQALWRDPLMRRRARWRRPRLHLRAADRGRGG
jgi:hypothetical protein